MNASAVRAAVLVAATVALAPASALARHLGPDELGPETRVGVFNQADEVDVGARDDSSAELQWGIPLEGCEVAVGSSRYLAPEPALRDPRVAVLYAYGGHALPAYSYAMNNPLRWVDMNGWNPGDPFANSRAAALDAFSYTQQQWPMDFYVHEFGGLIYQQPDGKFSYTSPQTNHQSRACNPGDRSSFGAWKVVGDYHNHPIGPATPSFIDLFNNESHIDQFIKNPWTGDANQFTWNQDLPSSWSNWRDVGTISSLRP
jgi:hypothetical protein